MTYLCDYCRRVAMSRMSILKSAIHEPVDLCKCILYMYTFDVQSCTTVIVFYEEKNHHNALSLIFRFVLKC